MRTPAATRIFSLDRQRQIEGLERFSGIERGKRAEVDVVVEKLWLGSLEK